MLLQKGGSIIGLRHNLIKKDWDEMCGVAFTPDAVTDEPKIHDIAAAMETHPPIGIQGGHRSRGSGYPYAENTDVGADLWGYTGVLGFWYPRRMCVFDVRVVDTDEDTYVGT